MGCAGELRTLPAERDQRKDAPADNEVKRERPLQTLAGPELQGLDPAARFQNPEEHLREPPTPIPIDALTALLQGGQPLVREQPPLDRPLAFGWLLLTSENRRHRKRLAPLGRQLKAGHAQRLDNRPRRARPVPRQRELHLPQHGRLLKLGPELAAIGERSIMQAANQPVGWVPELGRSVHESPDIAFAVGHIDEPGGGHIGRHLCDPLIALDPADALLEGSLTLGLTLPHPNIHCAEHGPFRGERQRRMQIHPLLALIAQPPQPFDARLGGEIQLRALLRAEHPGAGAHALFGALPMRPQNGTPAQLLAGEEPIRRLRLRPAPTRLRNARRGACRQILCEAHQAPAHALVSQISTAQLLFCPTHATSSFLEPVRKVPSGATFWACGLEESPICCTALDFPDRLLAKRIAYLGERL